MSRIRLLTFAFTWLSLAAITSAVKVDLPGQAERESSHILTGTVVTIYSKVVRDERYEWNHCVAAIRVESIQKGDGLKVGDLLYARYIASTRWLGPGLTPPGPGGHAHVPVEGERRKFCLTRNPDGGFDVYYVSGFQKPDEPKQ